MKSNRMDSFIFYLYIDNFPFDSNKNLIYRLYRIRQKILHGYNMDIWVVNYWIFLHSLETVASVHSNTVIDELIWFIRVSV